MSEMQTEAEFTKNVNTKFRVMVEAPVPIELTLVSVTPRRIEPHEQEGMERFSAMFMGPLEVFLPQQTYRVSHPDMGEFDIFLVALGQEPEGFRYEAVYNYYRGD
ncbi:MAG TPA: hypothetical protein VGP83_16745 [Pyrinomonadaceae bacterium]|jgi:hypothetical protein|nr:hypothetical protein [Pyrinomonadaceae bacterium]